MTLKFNDKRTGGAYEKLVPAENGQLREDGDGRIILVITDERYQGNFKPITSDVRALVIREGRRGCSEEYETVPAMYTEQEIAEKYPKVLRGEITILGEER